MYCSVNNFVWYIVITMAFPLFTASRSGPFPGKENKRVENVQRSCKNPQGQEDGCHSCVWNSGKQTERNFATFGCRKNSTWINLLAFQAYGVFIPLKKSVRAGCNMLEASLRSSRHLATLPLVSPGNYVWETSAEIPYWWRVTTQIWVVLLIGWNKFPTRHDQSEALPRSE